MKKIIFTTTILLMILIMRNAKPFSDNITGYNGAVILLDGNVYEGLARGAQLFNVDNNGALHDLKIPFMSKTYIVFEEN